MTAALGIAASIGTSEAAGPSPFTDKEEAAIEKIVRDYLMDHPELIIETLEAMQKREDQARLDRANELIAAEAQALKNDGVSFVAGNPNGDVTLVEFYDYNCGYCRHATDAVRKLLDRDKGLRIVFKEFPIRGKNSDGAARVSVAAAKQPKFLDFHFALMAQEGQVDEERALAVARAQGLDMKALDRDMKSPDVDAILAKNHALALKIGIDGTPAFITGTTLIPGAVPLAKLESQIAETRKACKAGTLKTC